MDTSEIKKEEKKEKKKFFQSRLFLGVILGLAGLVLILLVFQLGTFVGFLKAKHSYAWGEKYFENLVGPNQGSFQNAVGGDFLQPHGVMGDILKIDNQNIVIKGQDDIEKIIIVDDKTAIKNQRETILISGLRQGENIVVIGDPDDKGQIKASLIRVLPEMRGGVNSGDFLPPPPVRDNRR